MDRKTRWFSVGLMLVCTIWLAACAGAPSSQAPSTTDLLLQSGFQARPPLKAEHLQSLPPHQFVPVHWQGKTFYVYPDPGTNSLYFGNEAAYQRYKVKAAEARATEAQRASEQSGSSFNWQMYESAMGAYP
jgi:hypothetical protein